jgi:hypothetical protein
MVAEPFADASMFVTTTSVSATSTNVSLRARLINENTSGNLPPCFQQLKLLRLGIVIISFSCIKQIYNNSTKTYDRYMSLPRTTE